MDRKEALEIAADPQMFVRLADLNAHCLKESEQFLRCAQICPDLRSPAFSAVHLALRRFRPRGFVCVHGASDFLVLQDSAVLCQLRSFLGACVLSFRIAHTLHTSDFFFFRSYLGEDLFSYVCYCASYAPYARDLGIRERLENVGLTESSFPDLLEKCGGFALCCLASRMSREAGELMLRKAELEDTGPIREFFGREPELPAGGEIRLMRLVRRFLRNRGCDL